MRTQNANAKCERKMRTQNAATGHDGTLTEFLSSYFEV